MYTMACFCSGYHDGLSSRCIEQSASVESELSVGGLLLNLALLMRMQKENLRMEKRNLETIYLIIKQIMKHVMVNMDMTIDPSNTLHPALLLGCSLLTKLP